ncbi:NB-ARC domain containing protein [Trema orientale]|uniref:NB-ARC domain containing protein n=1 Tax=Trema orientale TaxID=63057 RepID=A0A2P5BJU7_TREOI|nr:NB-ARC domain containing protein [Trema orientale]
MSCKAIRIEQLSEDDALDLFVEIVGHNAFSFPNSKVVIKQIVQQCAGLPLALVTVAGSLKGSVNVDEWEIALEELRECTKGSTSDGIFERLKFSYDRLNDTRLQNCLLYCALYPEDCLIKRDSLIEYLIAEEIIEEKNTRQFQIKKGQVMLNQLVNVGLLNDATFNIGVKCVKMHDLVRDMALRITSESPRYLVKAGLQLSSIPDEEYWKEDVVKVSLMYNNISDIPLCIIESPKCPTLSTLLLCKNPLQSISNHFFLYMTGLHVLDLSYTNIEKLPESISDLVNLTALLLKNCEGLEYVPSLAKLKGLRKLDLFGAGINEVPQGMGMLVKLRYLDFSWSSLTFMPDGVLCKLVNLQYLSLMVYSNTPPRIKAEELAYLRKLETFHVLTDDIHDFDAYARFMEKGGLTNYKILGGSGSDVRVDKLVSLGKCNLSERILLPKDVEDLYIHDCDINASSLCELVPLINATKLKCIEIDRCGVIEHLFSDSYASIFALLQSLEKLRLREMEDLRGLFKRERVESVPPATFSSLKYLHIYGCNNVKKLFILSNGSTPSLEEIDISWCEQLEELVSSTNEEDQNYEEWGISTDRHAAINAVVTLPKLSKLYLSHLPQLQSIPFVANSLQSVEIYGCPKLKKIGPLLDREPCPTSLQSVRIDESTWRSLEWAHPNAKDFVQSIWSPLTHCTRLILPDNMI